MHDWTFSYWFLYGRNPAPPPPRWDAPPAELGEEEPDGHDDDQDGRDGAPHSHPPH
jgi:hypothetical protein